MTDFALVYITASSEMQATQIGYALVDERLAGCANVIPGVKSSFRWEGGVQQQNEAVVVVKTTVAKLSALNDRVRQLHTADTPAIVAMPLIHVDKDFAAWLEKACS